LPERSRDRQGSLEHGHSFSDLARKVVSIINLGSVGRHREDRRVAGSVRCAFAPICTSGLAGMARIRIADQTLAIGEVRLKVVKRIVRCAAINVDPGPPSAPSPFAPLIGSPRPQRMRHLPK